MKVIFVSIDRKIFEPGSAVSKRMIEYGRLFDSLDIIVFTKKSDGFSQMQLASNVHAYPTDSANRWQYMGAAVTIGKKIGAAAGIGYISGDGPETSQVAMRLARTLKAKFHMQLHTDVFSPHFGRSSVLNMMRVAMVRQLLLKADSIRVVSQRIADSIVQRKIRTKVAPVVLPIFEESDAVLWTSTTQRSEYEKPAAFVPENDAAGAINFLTVSRLEPEKDVPFLLDVFALVHAKRPETMLTIVGSGSEEVRLKKYAAKLGLDDAVRFIGWVDNPAAYYVHADIYMQTSLYEGFGRSLFEAALAGKPIVSTDVGLVGDVLKDKESVRVISRDGKGAVAAAAEVIVALCDDPEGREVMGAAARAAASINLLPKEEYLAQYKKLFA